MFGKNVIIKTDRELETRLLAVENLVSHLDSVVRIKTQVESVFKLDCPNCKHLTLGFRVLDCGCEFYYCGACGKKLYKETKTVWTVAGIK